MEAVEAVDSTVTVEETAEVVDSETFQTVAISTTITKEVVGVAKITTGVDSTITEEVEEVEEEILETEVVDSVEIEEAVVLAAIVVAVLE